MNNSSKKTVTILFADIEGYSKLDITQKIAIREFVEPTILNSIVNDIGHDSIEYFNSWGDSFVMLFKSVGPGVKAALKIRDKFKEKPNWDALGIPLRVSIRCSIHVGEVVFKEFDNPMFKDKRVDIIGSNIDITARIEPVTVSGRIWATEQVRSLLGDLGHYSIHCDPIGKRELAKGWGVRKLYDIRREGDQKIAISDLPQLDESLKIVTPEEVIEAKVEKKALVMLCGPSAVGKDSIASRLRGRLDMLGIEANFPLKFTTRPKRTTEDNPIDGRWFEPSSQYEFLDEDSFHNRPDNIGIYQKYGYQYGFDAHSMASEHKHMRFLICIYGDIESLAKFRSTIEEKYARKVFVVLLQSPEEDLTPRLNTRPGMTGDTISIRKPEMIRDLARVRRMSFGGEHLVMENSNSDNPDEIAEKILREILVQLGYLNNSV